MTEQIEVVTKRIEYVGECPVCHRKNQSQFEDTVNSLCASCRNKGHLQICALELIGATLTECMVDNDHNIFRIKISKGDKKGCISCTDSYSYFIGGLDD